MINRAYSLQDVKTESFSPPFFAPTDGAAMRMLSDLVADLGTTVGRHPSDFRLYCVGIHDDQSGHLDPVRPLVFVCDANSLMQPNGKDTSNG